MYLYLLIEHDSICIIVIVYEMAGMQRETIDKSKIEGKKIVWIMGRLILEFMIDIICTCYYRWIYRNYIFMSTFIHLQVALEVVEEHNVRSLCLNTSSNIWALEIYWDMKLCQAHKEVEIYINLCQVESPFPTGS